MIPFVINHVLSITQHNYSTSAPQFNGVFGTHFFIVDVAYGVSTKWCSWIAQGY